METDAMFAQGKPIGIKQTRDVKIVIRGLNIMH
jgi:hypothetical protein